VAKYSPAGALLWQREFDNPNTREQGNWITVDAGGNAIVVGSGHRQHRQPERHRGAEV
jgi:hypothetical protein